MKRKFLEDLEIPKETINKIMKTHGQSMQEIANQPSVTDLQEETKRLQQEAIDIQEKIDQLESSDVETETIKLEKEIEGYKNNTLKIKIGSEYNIPFELVDRLSGTNEEELRADAETLKSYIPEPKIILPLKSTEMDKSSYNPLIDMVQNLTN